MIFEALEYSFFQRALISGVLLSLVASYFSCFVVQRKMSFLGSGLAHASFGGVALGLLLSIPPLWVAAPFTILTGLGITWLKHNSKIESDTAIGIFFSMSMSLGIVFLSLKENYSAEAMSYLFGSILNIRQRDVWWAGALLIASLLSLPLWKRWAFATFDPELAKASHIPVKKDDYLLTLFISAVVAISIKLLGIVLLAAFLVIPGACSRLLSKSFIQMTIASVIIGVASTVMGLFASYLLNLPSGASIVLLQTLVFALILVFKRQPSL